MYLLKCTRDKKSSENLFAPIPYNKKKQKTRKKTKIIAHFRIYNYPLPHFPYNRIKIRKRQQVTTGSGSIREIPVRVRPQAAGKALSSAKNRSPRNAVAVRVSQTLLAVRCCHLQPLTGCKESAAGLLCGH